MTIAGDTRISQGYLILQRNHSKLTQLTEKCVIASAGMVADIDSLHKLLLTRVKLYKQQFKCEPTVSALGKLLSNTLYSRRFMPYYAFNLLCGIDEKGEGNVLCYDAVGSYKNEVCGSQGTGN